MKAIETTALTKRYKDKIAVDALNLTIDQGELFALLGVNGAGKTTTIKMLSCLLRPTSGDALLMGKSIVSQPYEVKKNINVSPQETAIAPNLSVRENLELICGVYGESRSQSKQKAQETITAFGMEEIAKSRAKTLSGGWQRRLSIAMALISEPQILFLDELARRELWKLIEGLKGNITILLTTHYLEEAQALSDRVGIMAHGKLKALGTAQELTAQANAASFEDAFVTLCGEGGGMA